MLLHIGYTQYWYKKAKLPKTEFHEFAEVCKKILQDAPVQWEHDDSKPPEITDSLIRFNGIGNDGHETFFFDRVVIKDKYREPDKKGMVFDFCKTARKPYDLYVVAVLIVAKIFFGDKIEVSSDGEFNEEWVDGRKLVEELFDVKLKLTGDGDNHLTVKCNDHWGNLIKKPADPKEPEIKEPPKNSKPFNREMNEQALKEMNAIT